MTSVRRVGSVLATCRTLHPYTITFRGIDFVSIEALLLGLKSEGVEEQNEAFRLVGV